MDFRASLVDWLPLLAESADRTRAAAVAGRLDPDLLTGLADVQAMFAHDLRPRPLAPLAYLEQARAELIAQVREIRQHDPARIVHIRAEDGYDYAMTPRKALRRELDHVLDHLNQVEQWLAWQADGIAPTPTDGWAPSDPMLSDDRREIAEDEHAAWHWRLDICWRLLIQRVAQLSSAQLEWEPPDGGWSLRRMLYHVGRGFYAHWLDHGLSDEPAERYDEASRRFQARLHQLAAEPLASGLGFVGREGQLLAPEQLILAVLAAEREAQAEAAQPTLMRCSPALHAIAI